MLLPLIILLLYTTIKNNFCIFAEKFEDMARVTNIPPRINNPIYNDNPDSFLIPDQDSAYNDVIQAGNRAYYDEFGNQILSDYASPVGQAVAGIGQAINRYVDQTDINNSSRPDLADSYIGDSWSDILWNGDRRSRAFNAVNSQVNDVSDIRNNYNLENAYEAPQLGITYTGAKAKVWGDILQDAGTGASLGSTFGPLGTAIGTGAGVLSGLARGFIGDLTNRKNANDINAAVKSANVYQNNQFNNTAINNDMLSQRKWIMSPQYAHYGAEGGSLEELNSVTKFNVGGTHQQNPYDGIQQGIASDGNPNLVEEGELKYKDYIYSARLKPSESLLKKYNLPTKYKGLTFAELGEKLQKESEDRPNDPVSISTLDEWMLRLQNAQEEHKAKLEERRLVKAINNLSNEEKAILASSMMQQLAQPQYGMAQLGQMPQQSTQEVQEALGMQEPSMDLSQPMYAEGGKIYIKPENRGKFTALKERTGHSATWFKEHGTPAQKKMATFALNARHWNHEDGGHLFPDGGNTTAPWYLGTTFEQLDNSVAPYLASTNPYLNHAYSLGYLPTSPIVTDINNQYIQEGQSGNWNITSGAGWYGKNGSTEPAFIQGTEGLSVDEIKKLNRQQLAERMRNTPAYQLTTEWLKANADNGLAYFRRILNDPNQPIQAKNWAKQWVQQDSDGSWNWKPDVTYNYDTMIKPKREDLFPGSYWYSHPDAILKNNTRNYLMTSDGQLQLIEDDNLLSSLGQPIKTYSWNDKNNQTNETLNYYLQAAPKTVSPVINNETPATETPTTEETPDILDTPLPRRGLGGEYLRYMPAIGQGLSTLVSAVQPVDYTLANDYEQLASRFRPVAAAHIGGYRRYNPYDVNLGDAENLALTTAALNNTRNQNRATQGALNTATIGAAQRTAAQRNLAWQQANEKNRLDTDTYNLGIDQFNANLGTRYDHLNQQILNNKINTLEQAAQFADASRTARAQAISENATNFFDNLGAIGRDNWNRGQRDWLLNALGREGILQLLKQGSLTI